MCPLGGRQRGNTRAAQAATKVSVIWDADDHGGFDLAVRQTEGWSCDTMKKRTST